ncbi:MAG TPA: hypothetical protein VE714_00865, partial [Gemmatimonadales bacterium]|nr:hypothetical protein [Gemmatimonadales bacterium]
NFTLSLIADDYPNFAAANGAKYTVPSWNTRDMFLGMSRDFRDVVPFPLAKSDQTFGNFTVSVPGIAGGSAAYIELSGPNTGRQLINLSALPAGTPIRLGIVRVQ